MKITLIAITKRENNSLVTNVPCNTNFQIPESKFIFVYFYLLTVKPYASLLNLV